MVSFPETFFLEEEREGFLVPSLMKRTWAAQMKVLAQLQDFFALHGLTYYAEMGTLLGAMRHKGCIPWDDDLDIAMPRGDYMKLQELARELPSPLRLKSFYVQEDFKEFHSVVSNSRETKLTWNEERMSEYFGCPFIVGIDIFPFDAIPKEPKARKLQKLLFAMAHQLAYAYEDTFRDPADTERIGEYEKNLHQLENYCQVTFDYDQPIQPQIFLLGDRIAMSCRKEDAEDFDYHVRFSGLPDEAVMRRAEWYQKTISVPYETMEILVPKDAEKVLEVIYGDWRTPVRVMGSHDYPFYKGQMEYFIWKGHGAELEKL